MPVRLIETTMSARELAGWRLWFALEPRGEERADWRTGWITYIAAMIGGGKRSRRLKWRDFVPFLREPAPGETSSAVSRKLRARLMQFSRPDRPE